MLTRFQVCYRRCEGGEGITGKREQPAPRIPLCMVLPDCPTVGEV